MARVRLIRAFGALPKAAGAAAGSGTPSARAGTSRWLRLAVLLAAALAVGVVRPVGIAMAIDSSNAQRKSFTPGTAYPGVILRGSEVKQDNDWNSQAPSGGTGRQNVPASTAVPSRPAPAVRPLTTAPLRFLGTAGDPGPHPDPTTPPSSAGPATRTGSVRVLTPALSFLGTGAGAAPSIPLQRKSIHTEPLNFIGPPPPARR